MSAPLLELDPAFDVVEAVAPTLTPSRRADGWTPERQRVFLEFIAEGHTVEAAARATGLTHQSAYRFRQSANGAAFALGWHAALLLQRQKLADTLTARAFDGQTETITRANGDVIERHRYDNRLALALLTRLDRLAAAAPAEDRHGEAEAARIAAQDWDAYLDLVAADGGPARAGLFLAARASGAGEAGMAGLEPLFALARADVRRRAVAAAGEAGSEAPDPAQRHAWSGEDWLRAEAAGVVALAPPPAPEPAEPPRDPHLPQHSRAPEPLSWGDPDGDPVWWDELAEEWRTSFAPPPGFAGEEEGRPGDDDYNRQLDADEVAAMEAIARLESAKVQAEDAAEREDWFAQIGRALAAASPDGGNSPAPLPLEAGTTGVPA